VERDFRKVWGSFSFGPEVVKKGGGRGEREIMVFEDALVSSMHDQALRQRLLQMIMNTHLPDDKQLPRAPAQLSLAVASIRQHHLLCESLPVTGGAGAAGSAGGHFLQGGNKKASDASKAAIDAWMERLLNLLSSTVVRNPMHHHHLLLLLLLHGLHHRHHCLILQSLFLAFGV
jgi:hypothetical protein